MDLVKLKGECPVIIAIAVIAMIIAGEYLVIAASHDDYSSSAVADGGSVDFTIYSKQSHEYCVASLDNTLGDLESVAVYFDPSYVSFAGSGVVDTGGRALDEKYYVEQIPATLKLRGVDFCKIADAGGVKEITQSPGKGSALIFISGAMPDTVYDGTSASPILSWISSGGRLYWLGGPIGEYISHKDRLEEVPGGASLFLGTDCIGPAEINAYKEVDNGFRDALKLQGNHLGYAVDTSLLPDGLKFLTMGYCDGSLSTITLVPNGGGTVCVIAGDYTIRQRMDLAQIVASCIGPTTVLVDFVEGAVKGHAEGRIAIGDSIYVTLGGFFPMYCERHGVVV